MRVTITVKDAATAFAPFDNTALLKELSPGSAGEAREPVDLEVSEGQSQVGTAR